eukprot:10594219-Heterocapsa_arctica.AAC.1
MFKLVNETTLERAVLQLHRDQPSLMRVNLFSAGTPRGTKRDKLASSALTRMVRAQVARGGSFLIDGKEGNLA